MGRVRTTDPRYRPSGPRWQAAAARDRGRRPRMAADPHAPVDGQLVLDIDQEVEDERTR